ncbi:Conserved_hypothetical protein [Hexamita inflata]|uniref:Uncharacterized protein n=1 Tax=Hexamita inflata TaxID=28002 RepID=A0ABP1J561_9EUKA
MNFQQIFEHTYEQLITTSEGFKIPGLKMLWLDDSSLHLISNMTTQSRLSNDEISLTQPLIKAKDLPCTPHVNALAFIRPDQANIKILQEILSDKKRRCMGVYLMFTSQPTDQQIELLAASDKFSLVQSVKVEPFDFVPLLQNLALTSNLQSLLLTQRAPASIRYQSGSADAQQLASTISGFVTANKSSFVQAKKSPVEFIIVDRKLNTRENALVSLNVAQMAHEYKNLTTQGTIQLRSEQVPFSFFTMSDDVRSNMTLDAFQVLDNVTEFKKKQKPSFEAGDLEAQSKFLSEQEQFKTQHNEMKNIGTFISELKDQTLWLMAVNNVQQQILTGKLTKLNEDFFDAFKRQIQRKESAEDDVKKEIAKIFGFGCLSFAQLLPNASGKQTEGNLKVITEFVDFLAAFSPQSQSQLETIKSNLRILNQPSANWTQIQQASQQAKQAVTQFRLFSQFQKPLYPSQSKALNEYKRNILALVQAAAANKLPQEQFPVLDPFKGTQAELAVSGECPIFIVYVIGGVRFDDAAHLTVFDDGEIGKAVGRCVLVSDKLVGWKDWVDSVK